MGLPLLISHGKRRDSILAIDLGGRITKAVHLQRRGGSLSLTNYALLESPAQDTALSPPVLAEHLKTILRALGGPKTRQVSLALGVGDTIFRQVELPLMPLTDMRQMLKFNSKNYLQQDLPDHVFDCCVSTATPPAKSNDPTKSAGPAKYRVMVGGARKQLIDDIQTAIREAGLISDCVIPGMIGPANAFEMTEPEIFGKEVVALVEIGFSNTSITILNGGEISLNRVVGIGGDRLTSGLAEGMGISYAEAENIKIGMPGEVQAALEALILPLGRELRASIDFFEHQADKTVSQIYVSGGSARSEFVIEALQAELMVPCKLWNPTRSLQLSLAPDKLAELEHQAPQLTVAIGAAAAVF